MSLGRSTEVHGEGHNTNVLRLISSLNQIVLSFYYFRGIAPIGNVQARGKALHEILTRSASRPPPACPTAALDPTSSDFYISVGAYSEDRQAAMSPQNECVQTIKEMMTEVVHEKNELVERLNAMHQRIAAEEDPVTKVRRKVEWAAEKERSVEALNKIVASLQRALEEEDKSAHGSTASLRSSTSTASRSHGASPQSLTQEHASSADRNQADFEATAAANIDPDFRCEASQEPGAAEPHRFHRRSPVPLHKLATWPRRRLPARLDKGDGGEPASSPASQAAKILRSFSLDASQLPQQVRKSVRNRARKFSSSFLRKVGWSPALQQIEWVWDCV